MPRTKPQREIYTFDSLSNLIEWLSDFHHDPDAIGINVVVEYEIETLTDGSEVEHLHFKEI